MSHYTIREPYWRYKGVGLAEHEMTGETLSIDVTYEKKDGSRLYPNTMYISKNKAMLCRQEIIKNSDVKVRIVPFDQMSETKGE